MTLDEFKQGMDALASDYKVNHITKDYETYGISCCLFDGNGMITHRSQRVKTDGPMNQEELEQAYQTVFNALNKEAN